MRGRARRPRCRHLTADREPGAGTLWASDSTAEMLEELQFTLNEGACMQAAATGSPVLVPDLYHSADVVRWPVFAAAVAEQTDAVALFALPLQGGWSTSACWTSTAAPRAG